MRFFCGLRSIAYQDQSNLPNFSGNGDKSRFNVVTSKLVEEFSFQMNCLNFSAYYDDFHDPEDFDDNNGGEPSSECHHNNDIEDHKKRSFFRLQASLQRGQTLFPQGDRNRILGITFTLNAI